MLLPCAAAEPTLEVSPGPSPFRRRETILLVEDEAAVRLLVRRILLREGYHVLEASNGAEGLVVAGSRTGGIDLLLTDVVMPEVGGRELAEQLLRSRPDLRILFMSGYTEDEVVLRAVSVAGTTFLEKPFTPDGLAKTVRTLLDSPVPTAAL